MGYTKELAQFAAQLQYSDLPAPVIEKAKEIVLHAWGVQLAGSTLPWAGAVMRYAQEVGGLPTSTVLNFGTKTSTVNAAFINGTFGHGFEMDDNHAAAGTKGGCVAVPAMLAVSEQKQISGTDFILAMVVAYEIMIRTSLSLQPDLLHGSHHATATCGPLGAAAAVGKLLGFDAGLMMHAICIAASHASGITEAPASGRGNLKRIMGGVAASNSIRSALLAAAGITGPETTLEGKRGFCNGFSSSPKLPELTAGLGSKWTILDVHYKIYAQDGFIQPMTEVLDRMLKQYKFKADDIEEISAGTNEHAIDVIGMIREPNDLTSAQFSANYSLALFMIKGNAGFQEYTEANLKDPKIIALSKKIHTVVDPEIEDEWKKTRPRGARLTIRLKSGKVFSDCVHMLRSMTGEDVDEKVRRLASVVLSEAQSERLIKTVRNLETVKDVSTLVPLLIQPRTV